VTDVNAGDFAKLRQIDGVLVGGASLDHEKFTKIAKAFEPKKKK